MKYLKHTFLILFLGSTLLTASCENKPSEKEEPKVEETIDVGYISDEESDRLGAFGAGCAFMQIDKNNESNYIFNGKDDIPSNEFCFFVNGFMKINGIYETLSTDGGDGMSDWYEDSIIIWSNTNWELKIVKSYLKMYDDDFEGKIKGKAFLRSKKNNKSINFKIIGGCRYSDC